jgi:hypothetical protein
MVDDDDPVRTARFGAFLKSDTNSTEMEHDNSSEEPRPLIVQQTASYTLFIERQDHFPPAKLEAWLELEPRPGRIRLSSSHPKPQGRATIPRLWHVLPGRSELRWCTPIVHYK